MALERRAEIPSLNPVDRNDTKLHIASYNLSKHDIKELLEGRTQDEIICMMRQQNCKGWTAVMAAYQAGLRYIEKEAHTFSYEPDSNRYIKNVEIGLVSKEERKMAFDCMRVLIMSINDPVDRLEILKIQSKIRNTVLKMARLDNYDEAVQIILNSLEDPRLQFELELESK
jgi:hypothetical protein